MADPAHRLLRLALLVAGAVAILATSVPAAPQSDPATATVAGSVKKPRPVKRSVQKAGRVSKAPVKRAAKRRSTAPAKLPAAPPRTKAAPAAPAAPNDPLWSSSWSLAKTNVPAAWKVTPGVSDTLIAVLDTGVDLTHPDLQGSFAPGYDVVNRDDDPTDDHGHGTMVAGVLGARSNNGLGGAGACSGCSLLPVKVIAGNGSGSSADIAEGIRWATEHGADVINMSFTLSGPDDGVAQAIGYAEARGVIVVAAAGNAGTADATFPAAYPGVVSVAATDAADVRYDWSSYGGWVRLAAPGCSVSTAAGGGYGEFCGTSSATAFVSGVAGLVRSFAPELAAAALDQALAASAIRVGDFVSSGRVDARAVVDSLKPARSVIAGPPAAKSRDSAPAVSAPE